MKGVCRPRLVRGSLNLSEPHPPGSPGSDTTVTRPSGDAFFPTHVSMSLREKSAAASMPWRHATRSIPPRDAYQHSPRNLRVGRRPAAASERSARCVALYAPYWQRGRRRRPPATRSWWPRVHDGRLCHACASINASILSAVTSPSNGLKTLGLSRYPRARRGLALSMAQLDLVMVPGLAFDGEGHRLGYGGGYYDRTLLGYTGTVMGVAFSQQIHASLPVAPHDHPMDGVICELGYKPRTQGHITLAKQAGLLHHKGRAVELTHA